MDPQITNSDTLLQAGGWVGLILTIAIPVVKWIIDSKKDQVTFERSQIITTSQWLAREDEYKKRADEQDEKIEALRQYYESKVDKKDEEISMLRKEIGQRDKQIESLNVQISELQKKVGVIEKAVN